MGRDQILGCPHSRVGRREGGPGKSQRKENVCPNTPIQSPYKALDSFRSHLGATQSDPCPRLKGEYAVRPRTGSPWALGPWGSSIRTESCLWPLVFLSAECRG